MISESTTSTAKTEQEQVKNSQMPTASGERVKTEDVYLCQSLIWS